MKDPIKGTLDAMGFMSLFTAVTGLTLDDVIEAGNDSDRKMDMIEKMNEHIKGRKDQNGPGNGQL